MIAAHWQTVLFAVTALATAIVYALVQPSSAVQMLMLGPLVALLGLPHGALDFPIAEELWPLETVGKKLAFAGLYLVIAGSVIAVWLLFPGFALVMFLAYSAVHFSDDWADAPALLRWSGGSATVGAPALIRPGEVERIFSVLAPEASAALAANVLAVVGAVALAGLGACIVASKRSRGAGALEQLILWAIAVTLPPLMYFAVYFCALHSLRHFTATIRQVARGRRALALAAGLSALVSLVALLALQAGPLRTMPSTATISEQAIGVIFIGLAALTVPHMILVDRFRRLDA